MGQMAQTGWMCQTGPRMVQPVTVQPAASGFLQPKPQKTVTKLLQLHRASAMFSCGCLSRLVAPSCEERFGCQCGDIFVMAFAWCKPLVLCQIESLDSK